MHLGGFTHLCEQNAFKSSVTVNFGLDFYFVHWLYEQFLPIPPHKWQCLLVEKKNLRVSKIHFE